jgi:HEAT repeat protein
MTAFGVYTIALIISTFVIVTVAFLFVHKILAWKSIKPNEALYGFFAERFSMALAMNAEVGSIKKSFAGMLKKSVGQGFYSRRKKREVARRVLQSMAGDIVGENRDWLSKVHDALGFADDAIKELKDLRWWRRADAVRELQTMRCHKAADHLINLLEDKNPDVKLLAFEAYIEIEGISSLSIIVDFLGNLTRWGAINLSRAILENKIESAKYLLTLVNHRDITVRLFAIEMTGMVQALNVVPSLLEIAEKGNPLEVRAAIQAFGSIGDERAVPLCLSNLKNNDPSIRAAAASVLGKFGVPDFVDSLVPLLDDEVLEVRIAAGQAISKCGKEGISMLQTVYLKGSPTAAAVSGFVQDELDLDSIGAAIVSGL